MRRHTKARIESISVKNLFGFLSYDINAKSRENLIILYGDNGSGKTTLLNLVFHALAAEESRGHRSYIAEVPLERLSILFADNRRITVARKDANKGPFTMSVEIPGKDTISHLFTVSPEGPVREQQEVTYRPLLKALSDLNMGLFLLPDDRKIQSNLYPDDESPRPRQNIHQSRSRSREFLFVRSEKDEEETVDTLVSDALNRALQWARRQTLAATSQGETDTAKMYADILKRISGPATNKSLLGSIPFADLQEYINKLSLRSKRFGQFGLVTPLDKKDILPTLQGATSQKKTVITQVLSPYLRSFEARLNALDDLRNALYTFAEIFERFFNYKTLKFDISNGIQISLRHNHSNLSPRVLSSGEKQLLLLFCNVLLARSIPSVFIIDEPELSLNVKWQRELITSLLSCVKDCDVQFLFATHSLEMISLHKANAVKLDSVEKANDRQ